MSEPDLDKLWCVLKLDRYAPIPLRAMAVKTIAGGLKGRLPSRKGIGKVSEVKPSLYKKRMRAQRASQYQEAAKNQKLSSYQEVRAHLNYTKEAPFRDTPSLTPN